MEIQHLLSFKKPVKLGDEIYIIVKECPSIILSGKGSSKYELKKDEMVWEPKKIKIDFIDLTSGDIYDKDDMLIDDDIVKFDNFTDARIYCDEKNIKERNKR